MQQLGPPLNFSTLDGDNLVSAKMTETQVEVNCLKVKLLQYELMCSHESQVGHHLDLDHLILSLIPLQ